MSDDAVVEPAPQPAKVIRLAPWRHQVRPHKQKAAILRRFWREIGWAMELEAMTVIVRHLPGYPRPLRVSVYDEVSGDITRQYVFEYAASPALREEVAKFLALVPGRQFYQEPEPETEAIPE